MTLNNEITRVLESLRQFTADWSAVHAGIVMLAGLLPLLFGWSLIRPCMALGCAILAGISVWISIAPHVSTGVLWSCIAVVGILFSILGWFAYQMVIALKGALLCGTLAVLVALPFSAHLDTPWPLVVTCASGLAGGVLGAVLGWYVAPWVAIVETSLMGTVMLCAGLTVLIPHAHRNEPWLLFILSALLLLTGLIVQGRRLVRASA